MKDTGKEQNHPSFEDTSASEESFKNPKVNKGEKGMARAEKVRAIRKACATRDVEALAAHATSEGGLLEDDLRQIACKLLWNITVYKGIHACGLN